MLQAVSYAAESAPGRGVGDLHFPAEFRELKEALHLQLLALIDFKALNQMSSERLLDELARLLERMLQDSPLAMNARERRQIVVAIQHEITGLGPLELLMADPTITDILVNGPLKVYVERGGQLELTGVRFNDHAHLLKIIDKIVSRVGRRIDESSPMVDARLADGSRVNAIIPPLALDGAVLSIRRFASVPLTMADLIKNRSFPPVLAALLEGMVVGKLNVLVSGGTGSGKTTMLNVLSAAVPDRQRIVTIEDTAELQLQQPHVVRLETRPANLEGNGEVSQRALLKNSLRMRPDRIILGEVRGAEALDMLQAMNTGHEGSMATLHANSPGDALVRLETMCGYSNSSVAGPSVRHQISAAVSVVLQVARLSDGQRKLVSLQEVVGMEGDVITMQEIYRFNQTGVGAQGEVLGHFRATGFRPKFLAVLATLGVSIPEATFDPAIVYD